MRRAVNQGAPEPVTANRRRPLGRVAALLFVALLAVYASNVRVRSSGDNIPNRLLPFSLLGEGDLDLDEFTRVWSRTPLPYYVYKRKGHYYSGTTVALPIAVAPLYVLPIRFLAARNIPYDDVRAELLAVVMERLSAAVLTALSAVVLLLLLDRMVSRRWALGITLTYALGTTAWAVSSQALWPHVLTALALLLLSWIFLSPRPGPVGITAAGVVTAVALVNRPQFAGFALLAALYVWRYHRRSVWLFLLTPVAGASLVAAYNLRVFHELAGAYYGFSHFSTPLAVGIAGLLFSPNRGLFVFTPIMAFAFVGAVAVWRTQASPWLRYLSVGLAYHLVLYGKFDEWWSGSTFGPRYFTGILPVLCLFLVYGLVPLARRPAVCRLMACVVLYGVGVQGVGVYFADDTWNREPVPLSEQPARVWDWSDWQVRRALRAGWHGTDLVPLLATAFRDPVPARLRPLRRADLAASYRVLAPPPPIHLPAEGRVEIRVALTNRGTAAWPSFAADYRVHNVVFLVPRWLSSGTPVPGSGDVLHLPKNVVPGETVIVRFPLVAPARPGRYDVELRVAQALDGRHGIGSPDDLRFSVTVSAPPSAALGPASTPACAAHRA